MGDKQSEHMKNTLKTSKLIYCLGGFIISGTIILCALYQAQIYPFGDRTLIYHDLEYQYIDYFIWLRNVLHGEGNIFYSFSLGMGSGTSALYAYYLASPFNLLLLFASRERIVLWISFIMMLKIITCSVSMFIYLDRRYGIKSFYAMLLSVSYAMMGYNVLNSSNLLWLDGVLILPLIALGIYQVVWTRKRTLYFVALLYGVLTSWYIGYILCLFAVIYFSMECALFYFEHSFRWKSLSAKLLEFIGVSALACFATSVLLIPQTLQMLSIGESNVEDVLHYGFNFSYLEGFKDLFLNGDKLTWSQDHPSIYVGSLPLVFLGLFFDRTVERKRKILGGVVLGAGVLIFALTPLSYLFSFAKVPSNHFYRHSFLYSFLLISVVGVLLQSCQLKKWILLRSAVLIAGIGLLYEKLVYYSDRNLMYMSIIIILLIGVAIEVHTASRSVGIFLTGVFLLFCMGKEYTTKWTLELADHNYSKEKIATYNREMENILNVIWASDDAVYRIDKTGTRFGAMQRNECNTESAAFGYSGIAYYSSTRNIRVGEFLVAMGYGSTSTVLVYDAIQPIDALLSVKYVISGMNLAGYEKIYEDIWNEVDVYHNEQAVSLGYAVERIVSTEWDGNPFVNHRRFLEGITGEEANIYSEPEILNVNTDNATYTEWEVQVREDGPLYFYCINGTDGTTTNANGINFGANIWYNNQIHLAGYYQAGDIVIIRASNNYYVPDYGFCAATLREEQFASLMEQIRTNSCGITVFEDGKVTAFYEADREKEILFTIPYEPGWTITVNGQKVSYEEYAGAFIKITVPQGDNEIQMRYHTPGLLAGCIISILSVLVFLFWSVLLNREHL